MGHLSGILPINKEAGITSHDVVYRLRQITGQKKIGHTGTLDPKATGLLLTCFERATRLTQFLSDWDKTYLAEITLGKVSDTLDGEGLITEHGVVPDLSEETLKKILSRFCGHITQKVPAHSAVKVDGRRLYKYARSGESVERPTREVHIKSLDLLNYSKAKIEFRVCCSKGTYIRTLADDIGREIGCGSYLSALKRESVGAFEIINALTLDEVRHKFESGNLEKAMIPIEKTLDFPVIRFDKKAAQYVSLGGFPGTEDVISWGDDFATGDLISLAGEDWTVLAVGRSKFDAPFIRDNNPTPFFEYVRVLI